MEKLNLKKFENISLKKDDLAKIQGGGGKDTEGGKLPNNAGYYQSDYDRGNGYVRYYT